MPIYALRSDGVYAKYEGMTQETVTAMLEQSGLTCSFVSEETYAAAIAALENHG